MATDTLTGVTNFISDLFVTTPGPGFTSQTSQGSPLSALYGPSRYELDNYRYPRDLGTNPSRSHIIQFTAFEVQPRTPSPEDFAKLGTALSGLGVPAQDAIKILQNDPTALKNLTNAIENKRLENISSATDRGIPAPEQKSLQQSLSDVKSSLSGLAGNFVASQPNTIAKETISLYVPDTLNVQYSSNYSDVSVTEALGKPYFYAQLGASIKDHFDRIKNSSPSEMLAAVAADPVLRGFVTSKLSGKFGLGDITGLSLNALGRAFNPQLQVLFTNIGFRSFQFEFNFIPYDQQEARNIEKIIYTLKYRAAPEITPNGFLENGMYQKIPDQFGIKFLYNGAENPNVPKIKNCVLTNINVDYAPSGWSTFGDGFPVQTKLTLQFQEIEIIDKNKIKEGY